MNKLTDFYDYSYKIVSLFPLGLFSWFCLFFLRKGSFILAATFAIMILIIFIFLALSRQLKKENNYYYSLNLFIWKKCDPSLIDIIYHNNIFNIAIVRYKSNILNRYGILRVGNYRDPTESRIIR